MYQGQVLFAYVYIAEAHAKDEWPCGETWSFCEQPKRLQDRCKLAQLFVKQKQTTIPMLVDLMDNTFEDQFAAWPFRFYGVTVRKDEQQLLHFNMNFTAQPVPGTAGYDVKSIEHWLSEVLHQ